jgi:type II secretory pathway component PulJ
LTEHIIEEQHHGMKNNIMLMIGLTLIISLALMVGFQIGQKTQKLEMAYEQTNIRLAGMEKRLLLVEKDCKILAQLRKAWTVLSTKVRKWF